MASKTFKVMVLAGGPDREREVSLLSGAQVAEALKQAGHEVIVRDILPGDLSALDQFNRWVGDVVFPYLHGPWGEGGPLQSILEQRNLRYIGCNANSARLCMDKAAAKDALRQAGIPTPASVEIGSGRSADSARLAELGLPVVVKPVADGSSFDVAICKTHESLALTVTDFSRRNPRLLVEQFISGKELTVSVIANADGTLAALPPIQIVPATEFYDYQAKYLRDDTKYLFDIDIPPAALQQVRDTAVDTFRALGCRHLSRVDIMVDAENRPWVLEVNTLPGFTPHSLMPMAGRKAGIDAASLVDRFVRLAMSA